MPDSPTENDSATGDEASGSDLTAAGPAQKAHGGGDETVTADRQSLWFFITALVIGGAEQTLIDIANGVDTNRYDVTVWTIFAVNPLAEELNEEVTVRSLTDRAEVENGYVVGVTNPVVYLTVPLRFCYVAAVERPAIIQSFLFFDNLVARMAGLVSPATVITGVRCVPNDRSLVRESIDRLTMSLSDVVVSNSAAGADYALALGAHPDRVTVVRNGREVERFRSATPENVRSELNLGDDELIVGSVGRLLERKGHFELMDAWKDVQKVIPDARLVLVGDGEDREAIERHAETVGCADSVEFLGRRQDIPQLLAAMDVFAFPSHFEGLPGAVIEAMAAGLPIVATPVDGTTELLDSYDTGLFVPVHSPDDLAWALVRLLQCPTLRESLGTSAQERACTQFSNEVMIDRFESLYREILSGEDEPIALDHG